MTQTTVRSTARRISAWWSDLSDREQRLLQIMLALLLPTLLWFAVLVPLNNWQDSARRDLQSAASRYSRIEAAASLRRQQEAGGAPAGATVGNSNLPVRSVISQTTQARGISLSRIQPGSDGTLGVWINEIDPKILFAWIRDLNLKHGISVRVASMQPERGKPLVQAQLQLRRGAN